MKTQKGDARRADAVTLAVCAALLLSSFAAVGRQGRQRAKEMVCVANLGQWHGVFRDYADENNGTFFTGESTRGTWWPVQLDEATQSWKKNRTWFCPAATRPVIGNDGQVAGDLSLSSAWGIYGPNTNWRLGNDGIAGSYGLNGYTIDIPAHASFAFGAPAADGWTGIDDIADAGRVPLFLDALRFDLWPRQNDLPVQSEAAAWSGSSQMANCCTNRHAGAVHCLFADGSARKVVLKALWTLKWHRTFNTEGPWTKAGGVLPSDWPQWMREFKDYEQD